MLGYQTLAHFHVMHIHNRQKVRLSRTPIKRRAPTCAPPVDDDDDDDDDNQSPLFVGEDLSVAD